MNVRLPALAIGAGAALAYAACVFPEFEYLPDDDNNVTGGAGMGGNGGVGGETTAGGGGVAGEGGAPTCETAGCGNGEKCSVVDVVSGAKDCVAAGPRLAWQRCNVDPDCADGLWCDMFTKVCHPTCDGVGDCTQGEEPQCTQAYNGSMPIPGLTMCTPDCNPKTASPCSDVGGQTTCYYNPVDSYWDCIQTVGIVEFNTCDTLATGQCDDGLVCEAGSEQCLRWCQPVNTQADCFIVCAPTNPSVNWDGTQYGICDPI